MNNELPIEKTETVKTDSEGKIKKEKKPRIWELDFLRGFAIIMVVFDHIFADAAIFYYDWIESGNQGLANFANFAIWDYFYGDLRLIFRPLFLGMFFVISGACSSFSRNNFLRSLKLAAVALVLINGGTYLLGYVSGDVDEYFIKFGVLHCFAVCIFFTACMQGLVNLATRKNEKARKNRNYIFGAVMAAVAIVAFVLQSVYNVGYPEFLYSKNYFRTDSKILGLFLYCYNWYSSDYFPLLPWLGFFAAGAAVAPFIYRKKKSLLPALDRSWHKPFSFCGKYSLFIYLISTVLCVGIYALVSFIAFGDWVIF